MHTAFIDMSQVISIFIFSNIIDFDEYILFKNILGLVTECIYGSGDILNILS